MAGRPDVFVLVTLSQFERFAAKASASMPQEFLAWLTVKRLDLLALFFRRS